MSRRFVHSSIAAVLVSVLLSLAGSQSAVAASHPAKFRCPHGGSVGSTCVAANATCNVRLKALYLERGLICVRRKLRRGGLAVQRAGGEYAVQANGQLSFAEAEQAFLAAGGHLPGVKVIPGAVALPEHADVTGPRFWIERFLSRLSAKQRRAVRSFLAPSARAAFTSDSYLTEEEPIIIAHIEALTGFHLPFTPVVQAGSATELGKTKGQANLGYAEPIYKNGRDAGCMVAILATQTKPGGEALDTEAHEITHCFQEAAAETEGQFAQLPPYYVEGYAEWAGDQVEQELILAFRYDAHSGKWITQPHKDLFTRSYDAFPLYDEVAQEAGGASLVWDGLVPLAREPGASGVYQYLKSATGENFERNLATNPILDADFGREWDLQGAGMEGSPEPFLETKSIDNGDSVTLAAPPRGSDRYLLDFEADLVKVSAPAPGALHLSDGRNLDVEPMTLCNLQEGCMCPDGTNPATEGGQMGAGAIAIWGEMGGTKVTLNGESKQEACGESAGKPPTASSGTGVKLNKPNAGVIASFSEKADCKSAGGTLTVHLAKNGGGQPLVITLPGFQSGVRKEFKFSAPANGGPVASYGSLTTNVDLTDEGEAPPAGGVAYNGNKFFVDATLFLGQAADGAFAVGAFSC
jgi:hypothetical protein